MHSFRYHQGQLFAENVPLQSLAEKHGTPLYVYSKATITGHFTRLDASLAKLNHLICYAVKANSNIAVLSTIAKLGGGFDIVSAGELYRVIKAGGDPAKCTFAGVGKTRDEIEYALKQGIYCFNAESEAELHYINQVAGELGMKAPVAVRVNPNVDAKTHAKITTGKSENKFGIDFDQILDVYARAAASCPHLVIKGLQMHIGSQLTNVAPFLEAVQKVIPLVTEVKAKYGIEFFSIGGGIGINYKQSLDSGDAAWWQENAEVHPLTVQAYAEAVVPHLEPLGLRILCEPGRFMVGNAGVMLTKVLYEKRGAAKVFKIVDAGMNDLIRPTLYEGWHQIVPLKQPADATVEKVDVVGPICESGDFLAQNREIPLVKAGEYLAVLSAGAYGFTMASNYNTRPMPAEILVDGDKATVVRERQTLEDVLKGEHLA
ncbi:diaminopimelate decarboxylase [Prosthecobacter vanneervenii]|uniref:Diaminopimelate decarboxylase n=1 Tax=Prosthecobacter vanneervenii TaxID=48466 RepID=A0A7W7YF40_9BACT|nr:diaminopimelate decarboxylase [Prosthecobacter vanneervenii]MBB5035008.1 diaminopimelate decarboxylase [Prosthecobacter vanneervenii]